MRYPEHTMCNCQSKSFGKLCALGLQLKIKSMNMERLKNVESDAMLEYTK